MTSRTKLTFLLVAVMLAVTLLACPISSTLSLTQSEMVGVMQGTAWPEGK